MTAKRRTKRKSDLQQDGADGPANAGPPDSTGGRYVAVDRIDGDVAVLIDDAGQAYDVALGAVAVRPREGMVLRVTDGADGQPDWMTAVVDDAERDRRLRDLGARAAQLAERDDGGDIAL